MKKDIKDNKKVYQDTWFYRIIKPLLIFLVWFLYHPKVIGKENIPKSGALVLAGNHTKWLDPVMLCGIVPKRQVHFLAKIEMFHGISRIVTSGMGCIPVNRSIHDKGALHSAIDALNQGLCIGIFPEGTINRTSDVIMPFKIGAVKMSYEANAKLVPFVITGEYKIFRKGIQIEFYKPISLEQDLDQSNQKLMDVVKEGIIHNGGVHGKEK